jgi:hypothetical protein
MRGYARRSESWYLLDLYAKYLGGKFPFYRHAGTSVSCSGTSRLRLCPSLSDGIGSSTDYFSLSSKDDRTYCEYLPYEMRAAPQVTPTRAKLGIVR